MYRMSVLVLTVVVLASTLQAQNLGQLKDQARQVADQANQAAQATQATDDPQELLMQIDAVTTLSSMLEHRIKLEEMRYEQLMAFLREKDQLQAFQDARDKHQKPYQEPMTFDHAYEEALAHQKKQPADPQAKDVTKDDVPGMQRDLISYKKIAREKYDRLMELKKRAYPVASFLHDNGMWDDYQNWANEQVAQAKKEHQAQEKQIREELHAKQVEKQKEERTEREDHALHEQKIRDEKLQMRFRLKQEQMYDNMRIKTSKFQQNGWGTWGDDYGDVFVPKNEYYGQYVF